MSPALCGRCRRYCDENVGQLKPGIVLDDLGSGGRLRGGVFDEDLRVEDFRLLGSGREERGMRDEVHLQGRRGEPVLDRGEEQPGSGQEDETPIEAIFH